MEADYVVVGAGSAGCAVAFRLSEDSRNSVAVIEAGGTDAGPLIQMPAALSIPMNMPAYDWGYKAEPEPNLNGRSLAAPRGRVIGGSSSINGMVYVRGHARDFDEWERMGAKGWAHRDVLPYYRRLESWHGGSGKSPWRGNSGPVHVTWGKMENPLYRSFIEAGRQAGYGVTEDYNGHRQEGFGAFDRTIMRGRRWSAAKAYLRPALRLANCRLARGMAQRVIIEDGEAKGVEVRTRRGIERVIARREVVLCASVFNTPKLLMLSGVGPAEQLAAHGIDVIADRKGVGQNLQDHLEIYIQTECSREVSLNRRWNVFSKGLIGLRWLLTAGGLGASNHFEAGAFIRSGKGVEYPDIQFHFLPIAMRYDGRRTRARHGFQIHAGPMRSMSRGSVSLRSRDPMDSPVIRFNYMSEESDWKEFRACVRLAREIVQQEALARYAGGEIQPGPGCQTDEEIDEAVREHAESAYHPSCTCRMGAIDDPMSVVDPQGRVIGVGSLRVADSSVFPRIPNGNLNAPSLMVGEKMSDHILGRQPLPPDDSAPWINPDWRASQR